MTSPEPDPIEPPGLPGCEAPPDGGGVTSPAAPESWNVLSLFSGIGGLELGLEHAGMTTVGQVEINEYCRRVLARHWPEVPRHDDVRTAPEWWRAEPRPAVDLVAGGFPCQGHSDAGRRLGTGDPRWGWPWYRGVIDAIDPPFVLIENVPGLVRTGLLDVLTDLADRGFDAWWARVPAAAFGAPHLRWRLFVIAAHPDRLDGREGWARGPASRRPRRQGLPATRLVTGYDGATWALADPDGPAGGLHTAAWPAESGLDRMAHGVPDRLDRLRALGNAVVPAVGEYIGHLLLAGRD